MCEGTPEITLKQLIMIHCVPQFHEEEERVPFTLLPGMVGWYHTWFGCYFGSRKYDFNAVLGDPGYGQVLVEMLTHAFNEPDHEFDQVPGGAVFHDQRLVVLP